MIRAAPRLCFSRRQPRRPTMSRRERPTAQWPAPDDAHPARLGWRWAAPCGLGTAKAGCLARWRVTVIGRQTRARSGARRCTPQQHDVPFGGKRVHTQPGAAALAMHRKSKPTLDFIESAQSTTGDRFGSSAASRTAPGHGMCIRFLAMCRFFPVLMFAGMFLLATMEVQAQCESQAAAALVRMDAWLARGEREAWHEFLRTEELRAELARGEAARPAVVARVLQRYAADAPGLNAPPIVEVRAALECWLARLSLPRGEYLPVVAESIRGRTKAAAATPRSTRLPSAAGAAEAALDRALDGLVVDLRAYSDRPTADLEARIARWLRFLESTGQAESLVAAVRAYYRSPDFWVQISHEFLAERLEQRFDTPTPINGTLLGTHVTGRGTIRGTVTIEFPRDPTQGSVCLVARGECQAATVGRNGPARIYSRSTTPFTATKRVFLDATGLRSTRTHCTATTDAQIVNIGSAWPGLRGMIVRAIASRRAAQNEALSEALAARQAERQIAAELDRQMDQQLAELNRDVVQPMLALACGSQRQSLEVRTRSAGGWLRIEFTEGGLGTPAPAPPWDRTAPLSVGMYIQGPQRNALAAIRAALGNDLGPVSASALFSMPGFGMLGLAAPSSSRDAWLSEAYPAAAGQRRGVNQPGFVRIDGPWLVLRCDHARGATTALVAQQSRAAVAR